VERASLALDVASARPDVCVPISPRLQAYSALEKKKDTTNRKRSGKADKEEEGKR
jgi:hypothetical protein